MDTNYGMEIVRATEIAALIAARQQGLGDHIELINHARSAIAKTLNRLRIDGRIVNDRFYDRDDIVAMPAELGQGGPAMELIAVALEAHHAAAAGGNNATAYAVIAPEGTIRTVPNLNMYKMVVGPQAGTVIDIERPPLTNVKRVARALGKYTENVTVCILDQPRHRQLIDEVRQSGARIKLIEEGEISGSLSAIIGQKADLYMGYGYAPESTLVAAAINCLGGYFEGRIMYRDEHEKEQARRHGITDFDKIFKTQDLIRSREVAVAATGVTDGEFLEGVRFTADGAITSSFIARAETRTYRRLETWHFFDYKPVF